MELYILAKNNNYIVESIDRSFVTLPYIEGQKYTFGQVYPKEKNNRSNFGEFIFLPYGHKPGYLEPNFQISCHHGSYYVQDCYIYSESTYLNDKAVKKITPLKYGDRLLMVYDRHRYPVFLGSFLSHVEASFLYELRKPPNFYSISPPEFPTLDLEPITLNNFHLVLQNGLILAKIFKFLPLPSIRAARLVCCTWMAEATPVLKSRSQIIFNLDNYTHPQTSMRLFHYQKEMLGFSHPNWKLDIDFKSIFDSNFGWIDPGHYRKFCKDFRNFFGAKSHPVKRLQLVLPFEVNNYLGYLCKILDSLGSFLEELELVRYNLDDKRDHEVISFPNVNLPKLHSLSVGLGSNSSLIASVLSQFRTSLRVIRLLSRSAEENEVVLEEIRALDLPLLKEIKVKEMDGGWTVVH